MKGMNKIKRGAGFRGLLDYLEENKDGPAPGRLIGGSMAGTTPQELAREFAVSRRLRPDIKKPVWHNSLRLPAGEDASDKAWNKMAEDYLTRMGFDIQKTQYCFWKHDDEAALHIVASRIMLDGTVYLGRNENLISTRVIQQLERDHELTITKGPGTEPAARRKPSKNKIEKALRTGKRLSDLVLQETIDQILAAGPITVHYFVDLLKAHGITARPNIASTGKFNGFSFGLDGDTNKAGAPIFYKGSALGPAYTAAGLLNRSLLYDPARDMPILTGRQPEPAPDYSGDPKIRRKNGDREYSLICFMKFETTHEGGQLYRWQSGAPAFVDHGAEITCAGRATDAKIRGMLDLAREKGWTRIELTGPREFQMAAALEAARRGVSISGDNKEIQEIWRQEYDRTTAERNRKPQHQNNRLNASESAPTSGCGLRGLSELHLVPFRTGSELLLQGDARNRLGIDEQNPRDLELRGEDIKNGIETRTGSATAVPTEATDTAGNRASETGYPVPTARFDGDKKSPREPKYFDQDVCSPKAGGDFQNDRSWLAGNEKGNRGILAQNGNKNSERDTGHDQRGLAALDKTHPQPASPDSRSNAEERSIQIEAEPPLKHYPAPGG